VDELLDTEPILWISSSVWFTFLSRRLKFLYDAHGKLWTKLPSNYGVLSGLHAFLMQSVIFTPPRVTSYVRDTLAALNYKQNCDRFGMFFLDLDETTQADAIPEIRTADVVRELKLKTFRRRKPLQERLPDDDDLEYPLGHAPTWKEITSSLQANPTTLIPSWEAPLELTRYTDCEPQTPESCAAEIFVTFTSHLWILLHPFWRTRPEMTIKPRTLADALQYWSVDFIMEEVDAVDFRPCHSGQYSAPGRPTMSFSDRRKMYFPVDSKGLAKIWRCALEPPGYISVYQNQRRRLAPECRDTLDDCLEGLLGMCQCLPDSSRPKSGGCIWSLKQKKIVVLTNPAFYKIKKIGKKPSNGGKKVARSAPAHRGMKSTAIAMMEQAQVPKEVAEKAYRLNKRYKARTDQRSARSKNKRKPPQKRRKKDDGDDEGEVDSEGQEKRIRQKKRKREESTEEDEQEEIQKPFGKKIKRVEDEEDEIEDGDDDWYDDKDRWDRANEGDDEEEEEENIGWERDSVEDDEEEEEESSEDNDSS
jgi:hypothetical protein